MTNKEAIRVLKAIKEHPSMSVYLPDEYEALDLAIKALEEKPQGEWIPVNERLPEKAGCKCLVTTHYNDVGIDVFRDGVFVLYLGDVIAWQPLAEPYKEGETE